MDITRFIKVLEQSLGNRNSGTLLSKEMTQNLGASHGRVYLLYRHIIERPEMIDSENLSTSQRYLGKLSDAEAMRSMSLPSTSFESSLTGPFMRSRKFVTRLSIWLPTIFRSFSFLTY